MRTLFGLFVVAILLLIPVHNASAAVRYMYGVEYSDVCVGDSSGQTFEYFGQFAPSGNVCRLPDGEWGTVAF